MSILSYQNWNEITHFAFAESKQMDIQLSVYKHHATYLRFLHTCYASNFC